MMARPDIRGAEMRLTGMVKYSLGAVLLLILCWGGAPSSAETVWVGPRDDNIPYDYHDLQKAVNGVVAGDVIEVFQGDYSFDHLFIDKEITLRSLDPNLQPFIESTRLHGPITFAPELTERCVLDGFTFQGQDQIVIDGNRSRPTIRNCVFMGNTPCGWGVIKRVNGLFENCLIADNKQLLDCGEPRGVVYDSNAVFRNCTIVNNLTGLELTGGRIENCIITGNGWISRLKDEEAELGDQIVATSISGEVVNITTLYSNIEGWPALAATGAIYDLNGMKDYNDPCFVQAGVWDFDEETELYVLKQGDYHLKSEGWRWSKYGLEWIRDDVTSPCIDAGIREPNAWLGNEMYSEQRVPMDYYDVNVIEEGWNPALNLGFYGGGYEASFLPEDVNAIPNEKDSVLVPNIVGWADWPYEDMIGFDPVFGYGFRMTATKVNSSAGNLVFYMFECKDPQYYSSGWSSDNTYSGVVGVAGKALGLRFRVRAKDSVTGETTEWSDWAEVAEKNP